MFNSYAHAAQQIPDYSESNFTESRADTLTMMLRLDDRNYLQIGDIVIVGKAVLKVAYDEYADEEEQYFVNDIADLDQTTDLSGLCMLDEYGAETPLHMLANRPNYSEIVKAINNDMLYLSSNLTEI